MATTFNPTNSGGGNTVMDDLLANTNTLRSSFSSATAPTGPVVGQLWLDTTTNALKVYGDIDGGGDGWFIIATAFTDSDIDLNLHQLLNARIENQGTDETPAAGNVGQVYLNTSSGKMKLVSTDALLETVMSGSSIDFIPLDLPIKACEWDATNPPTPVTIGTTPTIRGALFDATNEKVSGNFRVPYGLASTSNLEIELSLVLNAAETPSDTIDATVDYVVTTPDNDEVVTQTPTQVTSAQSIGANNSQYSTHILTFTLAYNDANNPIIGGDEIEFEFALSSIASVTAIVARRFTLRVPFGGTILDA